MAIIDHEGISNEAKLHQIATIIDNQFFTESIREQIMSGLDCSTTDYLKEFNIKYKYITENYDQADYGNIEDFREHLHNDIIQWIESKYHVEIGYDSDDLAPLVRQLYRFFVLDLKDAITTFLFYYIRENYENILHSIDPELINRSQLRPDTPEDLEPAILTITNLGTVLDVVISMNISFDTFIQYAVMGGDIRSINELHSALDGPDSQSILHVSSEDSVFAGLMQEMKDNIYDHNIVVELGTRLTRSFNIPMGEN
jgi:hypothetical protein